MSGGEAALRGFYQQAVAAVLEAATEKLWASFSVEPIHQSDALDILWTLKDGSTRADQVKVRTRHFRPGEVREWAREVRTISAGGHALVLIGPTQQSVADLAPKVEGVSLRLLGPNVDSTAIARFTDYLHSIGLPVWSTSLKPALDDVVERVFLSSTRGRCWSCGGFEALVRKVATRSFLQPPTRTDLGIHLTKTMIVSEHDYVLDVCTYEVRNFSSKDSDPITLDVKWTECDMDDSVFHFAPESVAQWSRTPDGASMNVRFRIPPIRSQKGWRISACAKRVSLITRDGAVTALADPVLGHHGTWSATIVLLVLGAEAWLQLPPRFVELSGQIARYTGSLPNRNQPLIASWRRAPRHAATPEAIDLLCATEKSAGCPRLAERLGDSGLSEAVRRYQSTGPRATLLD